jgi:hypothetical protein
MRSSPRQGALLRGAWALAGTACVGLKLWLVTAQARTVWGSARNDDFSYLWRAANITRGDWLGEFTHLTLHTGAGYPLWMALNALHPLPLYVADHLFYVLACGVLAWALRPRLGPLVMTLLFLALLFNPGSYDLQMRRLVRESIYHSQTLLVVGTAIGLYLRSRGGLGRLAIWALGFGIALGFFWITREEGVWLLPLLLLLAALLVRDLFRLPPGRPYLRLGLLGGGVAIAVSIVAAVAWTNYRHYGAFVTTEMKMTEFQRAVGAMQRVEHEHRLPYLLVPAETMERIARHAPSFREIEPHFGDARQQYMKARQALGLQGDPRYAAEIPGGWFLWALRNAASSAGYYDSLPRARAFWQRLADEIDAACERGDLRCGPKSSSVAPPWHREYAADAVRSLLRMTVYLARLDGLFLDSPPSDGRSWQLRIARRVTKDRLEPTARAAAARTASGEAAEVPTGRLAALRGLAAAYRAVSPWGALLALMVWLAGLVVPGWRRRPEITAIAAGLLVAIATRLALLAYIDVTSFSGFNFRYMAPLVPLMIAFVVLMLHDLGRWIRARRARA